MRLEKIGKRSFNQVYNDVLTYKTAFPQKAVIYSFDQSDNWAWAIFMAGGSLAGIPAIKIDGFLDAASGMKAVESSQKGVYELKGADGEWIYFLDKQCSGCSVDLPNGRFRLIRIEPSTGAQTAKTTHLKGGKTVQLQNGVNSDRVFWIHKL
jgi:hypothetical protein